MSTVPSQTGSPLISRERVNRGLAWFVALTIAALASVFAITSGPETLAGLRTLHVPFLVAAVISAGLDLLLSASRYQVFIRRIRPGSSLLLPMRADLASRFVAAVTPSQTGGGPAQLYVLHREGVPIPFTLSFLAINLVSTLVLFIGAGAVAAWFLRDRFGVGVEAALAGYALVACGTMLAALVLALLKPDWVRKSVRFIVGLWPFRWGQNASQRLGEWLDRNLEEYRDACVRFMREEPVLLAWSFGLTVLLYLNKFVLAWLIMLGMGVERGLLLTLAVQALLHALVYVAPSPGGAGIAEVLTATLMASLVPGPLLGIFTVTYRLFLNYLPAAVGGLVLAAMIRPGYGQKSAGAAKEESPAPPVARAGDGAAADGLPSHLQAPQGDRRGPRAGTPPGSLHRGHRLVEEPGEVGLEPN